MTATPAAPAGGRAALVQVTRVSRAFGTGETAVRALREVSAAIRQGRADDARRPLRVGQHTLLNIIGGLDAPDKGSVRVVGQHVSGMGERGSMTAFVSAA